MIKLLVPKMPMSHSIVPYIKSIDAAQWYSNFGVLERELRERLEDKYGAHVVTVSSCTAGLELMYRHWKDSGHSSTELPSLTFPATILAAKREGLFVEFTDVDPDTWVHEKVAGFGVPVDGYWVDAAAAFGEQEVKSYQTAVFSLHATKAVGAGEGGFIVTHDARLAEKFRRQTNFSFEGGISTGWGTNAKMSEYACAVALASLDAWDREPWLQLFDWYAKYLPTQLVTPQKRPRGVYPIIAVKLQAHADIESVMALMFSRGIETRRWYYPPMHLHPMICAKASTPNLPVTDDLSKRLLGLPYHLFLTEEDVARVCLTMTEALL